jgi:organic hydroperoxide reductase OsmC/OhrA
MHPFPHRYTVTAQCAAAGSVTLRSSGIPDLASDGPAEFDGPGNLWSPETLLCAAVADCFNLSFRAIATASKFPWTALDCEVVGTLDRVERTSLFTRFDIRANLKLPAGADAARAQQLLEKAKQICLISNSLKGEFHLQATVDVAAA